ncbi:tetratricopeptide repeat protein [Nostoc sp. GT001]|uniref:tetratricopeptide repeat protein n=1 Tax=Nostoc sp. GT001 TaxID=3056647 RepID=UPI0025AB46FD|nr:tetratricopeptide repeat protein [Nostoc sp. GT001]MDM9583507.1 tetratricopeptide repeat protein [Nostoc sp. GT001]
MLTNDTKAENQRNYQKLIVAIEASQGILNLLIAVCNDSNLREDLIQQYETELKQQDFLTYRIGVRNQDPSLRYAVAQLIEAEPDLQQDNPAVITVLGIDKLLSVKLDAPKSEEDRFFGYLQWTREALRQFRFPIVLWLTEPMLVRLVEKAPDFWSWRGGVFWFKSESVPQELASANVSQHISNTVSEEAGRLPLEEILRLIEQIEAQEKEAPLLATLYESLAEAYQQRYDSPQERQLAIKAYQKAIALQTKLGLKADLASSLEKLGNLYFEFKNEVKLAHDFYEQALLIYQEIGDKQGEANTLKSIGDVLQFLDRRDEALQRYKTASLFYQEIGDRLGEANTLRAMGDVLQFLKRSDEALQAYETAWSFYRDTGSRLGEANTLIAIGDVLRFLDRRDEALQAYETALSFYHDTGSRLGEANTLKAIGDVLQFLNRRDEALQRYEIALSSYRQIGDRLGEANILQEFGKLQENPQQALEYLQQAQNLYIQIDSIYSQSRNLAYFIANLQLNMGDSEAAINSLTDAAKLASTINYAPIQKYAQTRIDEINSTHKPRRGLKERFMQFIQQPWVKKLFFVVMFVGGIVIALVGRR